MTAPIRVSSPDAAGVSEVELRRELIDWLVHAEAANSIQVSILRSAPRLAAIPLVLIARRENDIVGVATWGPPFTLLLAANTDPVAIDALVDTAQAREPDIPGVLAISPLAEAFARAWANRTGSQATIEMRQRILAATHVRAPVGVPGQARRHTAADRPMLSAWFTEFAIEAQHLAPEAAREEGTGTANAIGRELEGYLWLNLAGKPVSIACAKGATVNGIRIGPVYTPPEHRRHGYAAAVTAVATQRQLDAGRRFVCLYTDLANPTSNHVYEAIGYEFVTDSLAIRFGSAT